MEKKNLKRFGLLVSGLMLLLSLAYFGFTKPAQQPAWESLKVTQPEAVQEVPKKLYVITFPGLEPAVSIVIDSIHGKDYYFQKSKSSKKVSKFDAAGKKMGEHTLAKKDQRSFDDFVEAQVHSVAGVVPKDNVVLGSFLCAALRGRMKEILGVSSLYAGCMNSICTYADCISNNGGNRTPCGGERDVACSACTGSDNCDIDRSTITIKIYRADTPGVIQGN